MYLLKAGTIVDWTLKADSQTNKQCGSTHSIHSCQTATELL